MIKPDQIRNILVIRLRRLGDTVLMTPCLESIRLWQPTAKVAVLVERPLDDLLKNHPYIDELIVMKRNKMSEYVRFMTHAFIEKRFDLVLNLHGGPRSAIITLATRARYRVGYSSYHSSFVYNLAIPDPAKDKSLDKPFHTIDHHLHLLEAIGMPEGSKELCLPVDSDSQQQLSEMLNKEGVRENESIVLIRPGATAKTKQWPAERFAGVASWILAHYDCKVVVDVGPNEESALRAFTPLTAKGAILMDRLDLKQLVCLINRADFFIGNDAGPTHIAAAFKKDMIVLFGGSNHLGWFPWRAPAVVLRIDLPCSPCNSKTCRIDDLYKCLYTIDEEEVTGAFSRMYKARNCTPQKLSERMDLF